jgi:hypothetical protein
VTPSFPVSYPPPHQSYPQSNMQLLGSAGGVFHPQQSHFVATSYNFNSTSPSANGGGGGIHQHMMPYAAFNDGSSSNPPYPVNGAGGMPIPALTNNANLGPVSGGHLAFVNDRHLQSSSALYSFPGNVYRLHLMNSRRKFNRNHHNLLRFRMNFRNCGGCSKCSSCDDGRSASAI